METGKTTFYVTNVVFILSKTFYKWAEYVALINGIAIN